MKSAGWRGGAFGGRFWWCGWWVASHGLNPSLARFSGRRLPVCDTAGLQNMLGAGLFITTTVAIDSKVEPHSYHEQLAQAAPTAEACRAMYHERRLLRCAAHRVFAQRHASIIVFGGSTEAGMRIRPPRGSPEEARPYPRRLADMIVSRRHADTASLRSFAYPATRSCSLNIACDHNSCSSAYTV
jgi:hypothetical protein